MGRPRALAGAAVFILAMAVQAAAAEPARPAASPDSSPAASAVGSIPDGTRPPARPDDLSKTNPDTDPPVTRGALIAPDAPAPAEPAPEPVGPPAYEALRESDFDFAACRLELTILGTDYEEMPALTDDANRDCGIARPLQIEQILPGITVQGGAQMRCDTARALAHWMRDFVLPAARFLPGAPRVNAIAPGTTYQCRGIVGGASAARVSEHALGNAIDVAGFGFADADPVEITPRDDSGSDMTIAFQRAARTSACLYFTTVLGPGTNAAHDDHLHLDVKQRRGGYRLCQ